jgi:hypothetical protein
MQNVTARADWYHFHAVRSRRASLIRLELCERTYMKSTSESLSHPETSNGKAAGGNCVVVKRGGGAARGGPAVANESEPDSVYNNGEPAR